MKQQRWIVFFVMIFAIPVIFNGLSYAQTSRRNQKQSFCGNYANTALQQVEQRNATGQPADVSDRVWTSDYKYHFKWCMEVPEDQANARTQQRSDWLGQNAGQPPDPGQGEKKTSSKREAKEKLKGETGQQTDQPPVTEGQTDQERNAAKREAKEKMEKGRGGAEQQTTDGSPISNDPSKAASYKKMDFGFNNCSVQFGDVMRGVSEDDMIRLATEAGAEGFAYHPSLKYGSLMIGSYPAGCKSPTNLSWPLYLKTVPMMPE